jgi:hypothetical protein
MSVNFNVRRVNENVLRALRSDPSVTVALCDFWLDFDPQEFEREFFAGTSPERRETGRASFETRKKRILDSQGEVLASLLDAGIGRNDIGAALHLNRSWWGMESMIHSSLGCRIVAEDAGEAIGEDVGYGPARLLSTAELLGILTELDRVRREEAEPRFRLQEVVDLATACSDEELDTWSWLPFCRLRDFVRTTTEEKAWVLKWYD